MIDPNDGLCIVERINPILPMKNNYFVLKATDAFGDIWPLGNRIAGIDGVRHGDLESAKEAAMRFKADKDFRTSLRISNGWEKNTIKGLHVDEVEVS